MSGRKQAHLDHFNASLFDAINAQFGEGGTGRAPSPPPELRWDFKQKLTLAPSDSYACSNVRDRSGLWARDDPKFLETIVNPHAPYFNRLAQLCIGAKIRDCNNRTCVANRQIMEKVAPLCDWKCFRDWAIAAMACQASFTSQQKLTRSFTHLVSSASLCHWLLLEYKHKSQSIDNTMHGASRSRVDPFGVCEVVYWMLVIQSANGDGNVIEGKWGPEFLHARVIEDAVDEAFERARRIGICQNRLWTLKEVAEREELDIPGLMEMARHYPSLGHKDHGACTRELCQFSNVKTETVKQLHKCGSNSRACYQVTYPVEQLEAAMRNGKGTVWLASERRIADPGEPYVAISHVWIDGTGIGIGDRAGIGIVNRCLADFFIGVLQRLPVKINAIWWDTISLPTNDDLRKTAINDMHTKYNQSAWTVVHDEYLLNFEWADDGSPCVALVLCSWFTRGWTALELHESKRVKVLYKGRDRNTPLIKDLDDDILAKDPSRATRAHWIASSIIRRLRKPVENVRDLLTILQPRTTRYPTDRTDISALLAHMPHFDSRNPPDKTNRDILMYMGKIGHASLMHIEKPMYERGPFSWAPSAVYDMPVKSAGDLEEGALGDMLLTVDSQGFVTGSWYYRAVTQTDADENIEPVENLNDFVEMRVKTALQDWQNCLLLREHWQDTGRALLVTTIAKGTRDNGQDIIDCRSVGTVVELYCWTPPGGGYDDRYHYGHIRLGNDAGRRDTNARDLLDLPYNDDVEADIPEDGEDGWISSGSDGPRVPIPTW